MKCKSCQGEVPPKFTHAIAVNMCPFCGEEIMDLELQVILKELKNCMDGVAQYPAPIFDWLKSNYNLFTLEEVDAKVAEAVAVAESKLEARVAEAAKAVAASLPHLPNKGAPVTVQDSKQIELDQDGNQVAGPSLQNAEQTSKFFKNALADKTLDKQAKFKNMVKQIKKGGAPMLLDENGTAGVLTPDMVSEIGSLDDAELAELQEAFGGGPVSSGLDSEFDYEDDIPPAVLAMAGQAGSGQVNMKDVARLQNQQNKSARAKAAMARGGSVGLIRR